MEHKKSSGCNEVKVWEDAFTAAGSLSGWEMGSTSLPHGIKEPVEAIVAKLKVSPVDVD